MATMMRREESIGITPAPVARVERDNGVSWGAILGGAFCAAALSLILLALGSGLGLSSISLWNYGSTSPAALGMAAIGWLFLMSAIASTVGGYVAGRLRARWTDIDRDEIHFRDTAHGLITWAVATIASAAVLTTAAANMAGIAATTVATAGVGAVTENARPAADTGADTGLAYFGDMMFRSDKPAEPADAAEGTRILAGAQQQGELSAADRTYLGQQIARRTGLTQPEAEDRAAKVFAAAQSAAAAAKSRTLAAAEAARQATAHLALWVFAALLTGAFCAAVAATLGGRERDWQFTRPYRR
jgi:hypothetical protein